MEHDAAFGHSAKWAGTMSCLAAAGARAVSGLLAFIRRQWDRLRRRRWDRKVERALAKLASGYTAFEITTEYDAKGRKVSRRVIEREVPPDPRAVKFYLAN